MRDIGIDDITSLYRRRLPWRSDGFAVQGNA